MEGTDELGNSPFRLKSWQRVDVWIRGFEECACTSGEPMDIAQWRSLDIDLDDVSSLFQPSASGQRRSGASRAAECGGGAAPLQTRRSIQGEWRERLRGRHGGSHLPASPSALGVPPREEDVGLCLMQRRAVRRRVENVRVFVLYGGVRDLFCPDSDLVHFVRSHIFDTFGIAQGAERADTIIANVVPRPADLVAASLWPFVLVYRGASLLTQAHVLMDVQHCDTIEAHLNFFRSVWKVSNFLSRREFLDEVGFLHLCFEGRRNRCLLWHGDALWMAQDPQPRGLHHGSYLKLVIPGEGVLLPIMEQAALYNSGLTREQVHEVTYARPFAVQQELLDQLGLARPGGRQRMWCPFFANYRASFSVVASERLPPPGNGIFFNPIVEAQGERDSKTEWWLDSSILNHHVAEITETLSVRGEVGPALSAWRWECRYAKLDWDVSQLDSSLAGAFGDTPSVISLADALPVQNRDYEHVSEELDLLMCMIFPNGFAG